MLVSDFLRQQRERAQADAFANRCAFIIGCILAVVALAYGIMEVLY